MFIYSGSGQVSSVGLAEQDDVIDLHEAEPPQITGQNLLCHHLLELRKHVSKGITLNS